VRRTPRLTARISFPGALLARSMTAIAGRRRPSCLIAAAGSSSAALSRPVSITRQPSAAKGERDAAAIFRGSIGHQGVLCSIPVPSAFLRVAVCCNRDFACRSIRATAQGQGAFRHDHQRAKLYAGATSIRRGTAPDKTVAQRHAEVALGALADAGLTRRGMSTAISAPAMRPVPARLSMPSTSI